MLVGLLLLWQLAQSTPLSFSNTHGDHMVLQQGPKLSIVWGFGTPGSLVDITLNPPVVASTSCQVGVDTIWSCSFGPIQASSQSFVITAQSNGETAVLNDVLFGDVWMCGGQSNMALSVGSVFNASEEIQAANDYPLIRLFTANPEGSSTPLVELASILQNWSVATNVSIGQGAGAGGGSYFSALCWFYGKYLFNTLNYPIGLISSNVCGTPDEAWSSPQALSSCPSYPAPSTPSSLWNAMIVPFLRYPIYGAIWYQGEGDTVFPNSVNYACTFPAMISDWRSQWYNYTNGQTNPIFPFGFVILSTWNDFENVTCGNNPVELCPMAIVRWGQTGGYGYVPNDVMPATFMAVATDWGDPYSPWGPSYGDIHPRYKQQVAARLTNAALAVAYNYTDIYWTGPIGVNATTNGQAITVSFTSTGEQGLFIKNQNYVHFEVGVGTQWQPVSILSSTANSVTLAFAGQADQIRYNWYTAPCSPGTGTMLCAVYSQQGLLPAVPFFLNVTIASTP